jgi:hypothetical protein
VPVPGVAEAFTPIGRAIGAIELPQPVDRQAHVNRLSAELGTALEAGTVRRQQQGVQVQGALRGTYVEFDTIPGIPLEFDRLDSKRPADPHLISVTRHLTAEGPVDRAVVWIPEGRHTTFLRKFQRYAATVNDDKPRQRDLVERIDAVRLATLRSLWTDTIDLFPEQAEPVFWELWLRRSDGEEMVRFRAFAEAAGIGLLDQVLFFQDRVVTIARAAALQLARGLDSLSELAEVRMPRPLSAWLVDLESALQMQVATQLAQRVELSPLDAPSVAVLDTGIHQAHPVLSGSLRVQDCHRYNAAWRLDDERGHGTQLAGLALYGSVAEVVASAGAIPLTHGLESARILPPLPHQNPQELWAAITASGVSQIEIAAPNRARVHLLATTGVASGQQPPLATTTGQPTSWSAAIDALSVGLGVVGAGESFEFVRDYPVSPRLFITAVGNVREDEWEKDHLLRSDLSPVEEPAQAWNSLSVGAFTELTAIGQPIFAGWNPVASAGELSPLSRTSVAFNRAWPVKPDVVFEGGNVASSPDETEFDTPEDFRLVTTRTLATSNRPFTTTYATSAAAAQAAFVAAGILARYPTYWPETIRALVVHSARWTPAMAARFAQATTQRAKDNLRRRYGMGVPSLERALLSAIDAVTLVIEDVIHPFGDGQIREMHLHSLPWPTDVLAELGATEVTLRVTLSYFIEPNPGRRGWVQRYAYPSHGLRFDLKRPTETVEEFRRRVNLQARPLVNGKPAKHTPAGERGRWVFGSDLRTAGSLHADIWQGTAADLAARGAIVVYPVGGWWKDRPELDRSEVGCRYSLIVSIESPEVEVDLYAPIAAEVGIPIQVAVDWI